MFHEFKSTTIAPSDAGGAWRNSAEITFQRETGFSFNEKRLLRTGGPADQAHIIGLLANNDLMLGSTGGINKWTGNGREIGTPFLKDPDPGPSGIGHASHMIEGAGYFTVPAARTLAVVNLNLRHT